MAGQGRINMKNPGGVCWKEGGLSNLMIVGKRLGQNVMHDPRNSIGCPWKEHGRMRRVGFFLLGGKKQAKRVPAYGADRKFLIKNGSFAEGLDQPHGTLGGMGTVRWGTLQKGKDTELKRTWQKGKSGMKKVQPHPVQRKTRQNIGEMASLNGRGNTLQKLPFGRAKGDRNAKPSRTAIQSTAMCANNRGGGWICSS